MSSQTTYFRYSLLLLCILFIGLAALSWLASLFVPGVWNKGVGIYSNFFVLLLNLAVTTTLVFYSRVSVNSRGINKMYYFLGKASFCTMVNHSGCKVL